MAARRELARVVAMDDQLSTPTDLPRGKIRRAAVLVAIVVVLLVGGFLWRTRVWVGRGERVSIRVANCAEPDGPPMSTPLNFQAHDRIWWGFGPSAWSPPLNQDHAAAVSSSELSGVIVYETDESAMFTADDGLVAKLTGLAPGKASGAGCGI